MALDLVLLGEMCEHVNNWFNPDNKPRDFHSEYDALFLFEGYEFKPENVPLAFLNLSEQIRAFVADDVNAKTAITGERWENTSYTKNVDTTSWRYAFRRELADYKRARTVKRL